VNRTYAVLLLAALVVALSCTQDEDVAGENPVSPNGPVASESPSVNPSATGSPVERADRIARLGRVDVRLQAIARLPQAIALASRPHSKEVYIGQRIGFVRTLDAGDRVSRPVIDISRDIDLDEPGALGLLGLAFDPSGEYLYVSYANTKGTTRLLEYEMVGGRPDESSARVLLRVHLTTIAHRGGHIAFGPDGYLWMGMGDGNLLYGGEQVGGDPEDNAQSLKNWNGKLLRIDPRPNGGDPYSIPPDNPFARRKSAMPEIYAYGLRNPWRFSFDRATGDLWIADVGQYIVEEINHVRITRAAGANFGWSRLEGTIQFEGAQPHGAVPPITQYNHDDGRCAIIGGYVYRGKAVENLNGAYVFSDFCDGRVRAVVEKRGEVVDEEDLGISVQRISSFGEDANGELYVLSLDEGVFRLVAR
jgi:glucose/arabinose dehydrogenase